MATTTANGTGTLKDAIGDLREAGSLGQALEALQANVFIADPSLNIVFANDCAKRTLRRIEDQLLAAFGVGVDEVIGGSIHRFHKDPKAVEAILKRPELLPHQAQFTFGTVTLKATINAISGHAGTVEGYIVNWEDVSDRLRVENEMARVQSMMENSPTNMMFADRDFTIRYMNPASLKTLRTLEEHLPVPADKVVGSSLDIFHKNPKYQRGILADDKQLPRRANIQVGPETLDLLVSPIKDLAGNYIGAMATWEVITDRLRLQQEVARVQSMMENSPTNMMFADRDFTIRYMNPASLKTLRTLEEHLPVPADKVVGSSLDIFHKNPKYQRGILADEKQLPRRANIQVGPETLDLLVSPIRDADGNYIGAMATWEVITEKLRLEAETKNAAERERQQAEELRTKVEQILAAVNGAAAGDLTVNVGVSGEDAIGRVGSSLSAFLSDLRSSVGAIGQNAETLASASEELTATAVQMSSSADHTSSQASIVSSTSEEVSSSIQTVAVGAEQLTASIREIAKNTTDAARVATSAVQVAESTNATVAKLGESSAEIGKVIKVITSIAQQTNLLALNATIEAARAGAAGKGFAVVANEVKELAKETAKATEDIGAKIDAIQSDTLGAVAAIAEISSIITQINDFQSLIAAAVEEQTATTNEIATNVHEAAAGSGDIARNIVGVADAAKSTSTGAGDTQRAASDLARMAAELQQLVARFSY